MKTEKCVLYDRDCIDCGECEFCDLDPTKICNNCGKCLNMDDYASFVIDTVDGQSVKPTTKTFSITDLPRKTIKIKRKK